MTGRTFIETGIERRPVPGLEGLYEITRRGDVYSRRLKRFVTPPERPHTEEDLVLEEAGRHHRLPVDRLVADVFLGANEREAIVNEFVNLYQASRGVFDRAAALERLAAGHHVSAGAILSVIVRATEGS